MISGYCISAAADRARRHDHPVRTYFLRRFRRIYPPLWVVIAASILFFLVVDYVVWPGLLSARPWQQPRPWWYGGWQWAGNLTLTETWRHYFVGGPRGHFPGQAWTLCYEEQFYAVTGVLLWLMPSRFFLGSILVTVGCATMLALHAAFGVPGGGVLFRRQLVHVCCGHGGLLHPHLRPRATSARGRCSGRRAGLASGRLDDVRLGAAVAFAGLLLALHPLDRRMLSSRAVAGLGGAARCATACTWYTRYQ